LVPKQIEMHGLKDHKVTFNEASVKEIIRSYTREAGVRNLERQIATCCRKLARDIVREDMKAEVAGKKPKVKKTSTVPRAITPKMVTEFLGANKFRFGKIEGQNEIGLTNGLAWTEVGGDLLVVEVSVVPGRGKFTVTGQLGDVMKESCSASMSYVRSRGPLFDLDKEFYANHDVHIHVPEGAIPKDGPSAGIAITCSIVSAILKVPVKRNVAMTGEVTLRGRVLAIGGLKEKVMAAHRGGIRMIIVPKENEKDLKDIPKEIMKDLKVILVDHVDQVLVNALDVKNPKEVFKVRGERDLGIRAQHTGHETHTH
jgi:ATP-dependent Lon protease